MNLSFAFFNQKTRTIKMHSSIAEVEKRQTPCWRSVSIFLLGGWQKEGESETEVTQPTPTPTPTPAPPLSPTMIYLWLSLPVNVFSLFELGCAKRKQNSLNRSRRTLPTHWLFRYKFWWPTVEPRYYREYVITEEFVISRFYCLVFFLQTVEHTNEAPQTNFRGERLGFLTELGRHPRRRIRRDIPSQKPGKTKSRPYTINSNLIIMQCIDEYSMPMGAHTLGARGALSPEKCKSIFLTNYIWVFYQYFRF